MNPEEKLPETQEEKIRYIVRYGTLASYDKRRYHFEPYYDVPFDVLCVLSPKFVETICTAFLDFRIDAEHINVIGQRHYESREGGYIAMDAAAVEDGGRLIDIETFSGHEGQEEIFARLERYAVMFWANQKALSGQINYMLALLGGEGTHLHDENGNEVPSIRYRYYRSFKGVLIPFEFVLINLRAKHEDPFVQEVCQDLLMGDPNQMHNIDIKNAYMALLTNKEFKIAMCEREEEIWKQALEEGKQQERERIIRNNIKAGKSAEEICDAVGISREELKTKYGY